MAGTQMYAAAELSEQVGEADGPGDPDGANAVVASSSGRLWELGRRIGPYEILGTLGSGGMGRVYKARDTRLGREVAVKVLHPSLLDMSHAAARFEREAKASAAIAHPNVVTLLEIGSEGKIVYLVYELLDGESLRDRIDRGRMDWREAAGIAAEVAAGLEIAHGKGITHRDLKPANIHLTSSGTTKILDFGLAHVKEPARASSNNETAVLNTQPGCILGTARYMSPEQARGAAVGPASDVFAFGCVLYEMLTGRRAFDGPTPSEIIATILRDDPLELRAFDTAVPQNIQEIVKRCLNKNAAERFANGGELRRELERALAEIGRDRPAQDGKSRDEDGLIAKRSLRRFMARESRGPKLAMLPLNLIGGQRKEREMYTTYGAGVAEAVISEIAGIPGLSVVTRRSAAKYSEDATPYDEIAEGLGVDYVLEGSLTFSGRRVRLSFQLIDIAQDHYLWSRTFERAVKDPLAFEREVARGVGKDLRRVMGGILKERAGDGETQLPEPRDWFAHAPRMLASHIAQRCSAAMQMCER